MSPAPAPSIGRIRFSMDLCRCSKGLQMSASWFSPDVLQSAHWLLAGAARRICLVFLKATGSAARLIAALLSSGARAARGALREECVFSV